MYDAGWAGRTVAEMSIPDPAIQKTLDNESGVPIENDNGRGLSVWGVTYTTVTGLGLGWTMDYLRNLTRDQAADFYLKYFWNPSHLELITDQDVANKVFDTGVVNGMATSIMLLQISVNMTPDGIIGQKTAEAVNSMSPVNALNHFIYEITMHYRGLIEHNPQLQADLAGWFNRLHRG